jgi:hypothetical protein
MLATPRPRLLFLLIANFDSLRGTDPNSPLRLVFPRSCSPPLSGRDLGRDPA